MRAEARPGSDVERAPLAERPRLLLELIAAKLTDLKRLPPAGAFTVRELTRAAQLAARKPIARACTELALTAERARYADDGVSPAVVDRRRSVTRASCLRDWIRRRRLGGRDAAAAHEGAPGHVGVCARRARAVRGDVRASARAALGRAQRSSAAHHRRAARQRLSRRACRGSKRKASARSRCGSGSTRSRQRKDLPPSRQSAHRHAAGRERLQHLGVHSARPLGARGQHAAGARGAVGQSGLGVRASAASRRAT